MKAILDRGAIEKILPHRAPFLFVDSVLEMDKGKRILASRKFIDEDYFFAGHFPGNPVVPGVILAEAMAQAAGLLAYCSTGRTYKDSGAILLRFDKMAFRRIVRPDEEVIMEATLQRRRNPVWKFVVSAKVGDETCADGVIMASFTE